jgi:ribosomal protein S21
MSIIVKASGKDSTDSIIKKFQRIVAAEDVIREYRERAVYKKASQKKQERRAEKMRKIRRAHRLAQSS